MFKKVHLDYDYDFFLNANYDKDSELSCISYQVIELADLHAQYGGFPDSYVLDNTRIYQLWWDRTQIDFDDIGNQLGIEVITVSSIKQRPGGVIPYHRDTFYKITQQYPNRSELKVRANIHLSPWSMGHIIEYGDEVYRKWNQGDGLLWDSSILHLGANNGFKDKYTLQVSGFLMEEF